MPNVEAAKSGKPSRPKFFSRVARFFKDLKGEIKRVVWPSKKQVINNTLVVIAFVIIAAIFIGLLDGGLAFLMDLFLKSV